MHLFFSTPIWTSKISNFENINSEMLEYITSLQKKDPLGIIKSNFKGWHSKNFDLKNDPPKQRFYWGAAVPQTPCNFYWGASSPQTPWRRAGSPPRPPAYREAPPLGLSVFSWYQDYWT